MCACAWAGCTDVSACAWAGGGVNVCVNVNVCMHARGWMNDVDIKRSLTYFYQQYSI